VFDILAIFVSGLYEAEGSINSWIDDISDGILWIEGGWGSNVSNGIDVCRKILIVDQYFRSKII
jgi:hypothetical protein